MGLLRMEAMTTKEERARKEDRTGSRRRAA